MSATATATCPSCGGQTPAGKKFCIDCGMPVREACPTFRADPWLERIDGALAPTAA